MLKFKSCSETTSRANVEPAPGDPKARDQNMHELLLAYKAWKDSKSQAPPVAAPLKAAGKVS